MKKRNANGYLFILTILLTAGILLVSCGRGSKKPPPPGEEPGASLKKGVILVDFREKQKVDVYIDGDLFTSYIYPPDLDKPVLYPVRTAEGTVVTRRFPLEARAGERVDHPWHVGVWFSFGDVNGYDFWNACTNPTVQEPCGRILHRGVKRAESREDRGVLEIAADWQVPAQEGKWHTILQELTFIEFSGDEHTRTIDRITQLTAQEKEVIFSDDKEGLFAIRVAREFEHPSDEPVILTDEDGKPGESAKVDNEGVNGHYLNSEGIEGTGVWGKKARWVSLSSNIGEEDISITLFDHPENFGFPAHWHARDYGLFAINNFGAKAFDGDQEAITIKLLPGESMILRHRLYITSGFHASTDKLEEVYRNFSSR